MSRPLKKNVQLEVFYNWEDENLMVRAVKSKSDSTKILTESVMHIKLDMMKIKILKSKEVSDWLDFTGSDILIA